MSCALEQARLAEQQNEVPVGAVVVIDDAIVATGFNKTITNCDPSAHAEVVAIRNAASEIKNYRILDSCLYVTLEPCSMCAGLLVQSRIKRLVFGAYDHKAGAAGSVFNIASHLHLNHQVEIVSGVLESPCSTILSDFFAKRRKLKKQLKSAK